VEVAIPQPPLKKFGQVVAFTIVTFSLSACNNSSLNADSKCSDYIKSDFQTRYDFAVRVTSELQVQDAGNPMWELTLDASCGQQPTRTIREALGKGAANATNDQSYDNSTSPSLSNTQPMPSSSPSPTSISTNPLGQIGTSASGKDAGNSATGGIG
jgi:hypothetical protein